MMKFELGLENPIPARAQRCGHHRSGLYRWRFYSLSPYMLMSEPHQALLYSAGFTFLALLIFGFIKGSLWAIDP